MQYDVALSSASPGFGLGLFEISAEIRKKIDEGNVKRGYEIYGSAEYPARKPLYNEHEELECSSKCTKEDSDNSDDLDFDFDGFDLDDLGDLDDLHKCETDCHANASEQKKKMEQEMKKFWDDVKKFRAQETQ